MSKKNFESKLAATVVSQDHELEARLAKADKLFAAAPPARVAVPLKASAQGNVGNVVRDTYSMPLDEFDQIDQFRSEAAKHGQFVSKSEVLRAGLAALAQLTGEELAGAFSTVQRLKPGRKT
jgi:hypothetical protein